MKVAVVIPTRNEAGRIGQLLATIPRSVGVVVVDASQDSTPAIVQTQRPDALIIHSTARIAEARQIGSMAAQADWLVFSDADVAFAPGYFERLHAYQHLDGYYGPKRATAAHPTYDAIFNHGQRLCQFCGFPAASGSNMIVRRVALLEAGGFRCDLPVNEDTELFLRMAFLGYPIGYAPDLVVHSLDDRRLDRGATRKLIHSALRSLLIALDLRIGLPPAWLQHDWGYWKR
jgi:GT2 family glycosyltransferase